MEKDDVYCDTELCLSPGGGTAGRRRHHSASNSNNPIMKSGSTINPNNEQHQQITIFYGGRMCTCDVTELQARAIICMAKQDMEERMAPPPPPPPPPINPGLSVKTSLHHFLQKRKTRVTSPSNE